MHPILQRMHWLDANVLYKEKVDRCLEWLVSNGITGKRFMDFFQGECASSDLGMYTRLVQMIEKDKEKTTLIYGKDFVK